VTKKVKTLANLPPKKRADPFARKRLDRNPLEVISDVTSIPGRLAKDMLAIPEVVTDSVLIIAGTVLAGPWITGTLALGTFLGRRMKG